MKKKYIIWDFDGTLVNTNDIILESWRATYRHYLGKSLPDDEIVATFGETLRYTISRKLPGEPFEEVCAYYRNYQDANCAGKVHVFEGVKEVLDELKAGGHKLAVATSRTASSYERYMTELGLGGYMDAAVTMEAVTKHKPDPESVLKALERLGAGPEESIMIGDSKYDIGSANNAGVESVLVGWSHPADMDDMRTDGFEPTYCIKKPEELLKLV